MASIKIRRLMKEAEDVRNANINCFHDFHVDDENVKRWEALIVPDFRPFNKGAFRVEINFPPEHPFSPPSIVFKTKIYHPNIDSQGRLCIHDFCPSEWKPKFKMTEIIPKVIALLEKPCRGHGLRQNILREFIDDPKKYLENAEKFTEKYAEKRPEFDERDRLEGKCCSELLSKADEAARHWNDEALEDSDKGKCTEAALNPSSKIEDDFHNMKIGSNKNTEKHPEVFEKGPTPQEWDQIESKCPPLK